MLERLELRIAFGIDARDHLDALLSIAELGIAMFQEGHATFVTAQTLFESCGAVVEATKNSFELGESFFK